jgi:hemerythrin superfamily protein
MPEDIYQALHADHQRVEQLLDAILTGQGGVDQRFAELQVEYTQHERAEERVFYEPLLRPTATHEQVLEGFEEHHVADVVMLELASQPNVLEEHWHAKAVVLKELIDHHIAEEEGELFPLARQAMDEDWAANAERTFRDAKARLARTGRL